MRPTHHAHPSRAAKKAHATGNCPSPHTPIREPKLGGAIALALDRAKLKK
jgi:hypothetical protein